MARTTGWAPCGQRLVDHAPFGRRRTQTFIRALRHDRSDAPWVIDGALNGRMVGFYIKTQPVPTLRPGDAVIPDNRSGHKSPGGAQTVQDIAARFPFLPQPPYSPDLDPMEMAFPKLKTVIRKAAARTCDQLWQAVGHVRDLFSEEKCCNCFIANGYETKQPQNALGHCRAAQRRT